MDNTAADNDIILELKDAFLSKGGTLVLDNVSLSVKKNTSTIITGTLGSGKSTLLKGCFRHPSC